MLENSKYFILAGILMGSMSVPSANMNFPQNFLFGVATSAHQIEGGWNASGKGNNIWDTFTHNHPDRIKDERNADISADSYHFFDKDLELLKTLKVDFYRFSISWSRILPTGDVSSLNLDGLRYYNDIIDKLFVNGIKPVVTMYHFDLPEELQKLGGFLNPLILKYFEAYADILFENFGNRVPFWITFNEPYDYCSPGYSTGYAAPGIHLNGIGEYLCNHHSLQAHALVYKLYKDRYFEKFQGKIGIVQNSGFYYAKASNFNDLTDTAMNFRLGWLMHPIFSTKGGYPPVMIDIVSNNSAKEGRRWSRLPEINEDWSKLIKGSADFLGLNYYTSRIVEYSTDLVYENPSVQWDSGLNYSVDLNWKKGQSSWSYIVPEGLRHTLSWIKDQYGDVEVLIGENGFADPEEIIEENGKIYDEKRVKFIKDHLVELSKAINIDKCNVIGYSYWSLIDNFEWNSGYSEKFGLFSVNFESPSKERTGKLSALYYQLLLETRTIPEQTDILQIYQNKTG